MSDIIKQELSKLWNESTPIFTGYKIFDGEEIGSLVQKIPSKFSTQPPDEVDHPPVYPATELKTQKVSAAAKTLLLKSGDNKRAEVLSDLLSSKYHRSLDMVSAVL